jgi:hypothetical protein
MMRGCQRSGQGLFAEQRRRRKCDWVLHGVAVHGLFYWPVTSFPSGLIFSILPVPSFSSLFMVADFLFFLLQRCLAWNGAGF